MINARYRFHGHGSLKYLHSKARIVRGKGVSIKYTPNTKNTHYRAAVVVSKKVHKSALVRNRIRRRTYEVIRLHTNPAVAYDFAVMVYDVSLATMEARQLEQRIVGLLTTAKLANQR